MTIEISLDDENFKQAVIDLPNTIDFSNMISIPEGDYGFAEIYKIHDTIFVFLIPLYGGKPSYYKSYKRHSIDVLISDLKSIT